MRKQAKVSQASAHVHGASSMTVDEDLILIRKKVEYLKQHPKKLHKIMVSAGIYDEEGRLTKEYGG
jgi:hypothetical protein